MSTNYYWILEGGGVVPTGERVPIDLTDPVIHIGKTAGAGAYCFRCKVTLCKEGIERIHYGAPFYDACPQCGAVYKPERHVADKAVRYAASFTWAQDPEAAREACKKHIDDEIVLNEYNERKTGAAFLRLLDECPIHFTHSVGERFS